MALAKCPDCGRAVSTDAQSCPNCGRPGPFKQMSYWQEYWHRTPWYLKPILVAIIAVVAWIMAGGFVEGLKGTSSPSQPTATTAQYQQALARTNERLGAMMKDRSVEGFAPGYRFFGNVAIEAYASSVPLLIEAVWSVGGTLYAEVPVSPWYEAGADAREKAASSILKAWSEELKSAGVASWADAKVIVQDKQRVRIAQAP